MPEQSTFGPRDISIVNVAAYHKDTDSSLRLFFTDINPYFEVRFFGQSRATIEAELLDRLSETDFRSALAILTRLEAAFRVDYDYRCKKRKKDAISKAFRALYKEKKDRARLEDDILRTWRESEPGARDLIGELKSAFRFRHWLAHGAFREPKVARRYAYEDIYALAEITFAKLELLGR